MSNPEREVLAIDYELASEMCHGGLAGGEEVQREMVDEHHWYNIFQHIVKNSENGEFPAFWRNAATGDGEREQWDLDSNDCVELTQVFPAEVTTIQYK